MKDDASPSNTPINFTTKSNSPKWLTYAIASGVCAATNGVFAKLTTTTSTQTIATSLAHLLGFSHALGIVEVALRGFFFTLNLLSNATMWFLFTRALTLATSSTQVAVLNTSANFLATAALGMAVFGEVLSVRWWCGAALLVTGCVIIGRRDEGSKDGKAKIAGKGTIGKGNTESGGALREPGEHKIDEEDKVSESQGVRRSKIEGHVVKRVKNYTDADELKRRGIGGNQ